MAKFEVVKQQDLQDCGACCLESIIKYYNGFVPHEKIRDDTFTTSTGTTAYNLIEAAKGYGFDAVGVRVGDVKNKDVYLPAIAHVVLKNGLNHFVVIYKVSKSYVLLMDPAIGKVKMSVNEFKEIWDNILILLTPIDKIIKYDKNITISSLLIKLIRKNKSIFIKICFINIILMIFIVLTSFYFQFAISAINEGQDGNYLSLIILFFALTYIFKTILNFIKNYYLIYFYKNLDVEILTDFLSHIFYLPLKFMQNRSTGEIISRVQELSEVKEFLSEFFTNVLLNTILIIGTGVVLYSLSSKLFFLLCLVIAIYIGLGLLFSKIIYRKVKDNIKTSTDFNSMLVENVEMNTSIKNLSLTDIFLRKLEEKLVIMLKSNFKTQSVINYVTFAKDICYEMGLLLVMSIGIVMIYKGQLNILSLVTFNSLVLYLLNPIQDFINLIPKYSYLKATFKKLTDFINVEVEKLDEGLTLLEKGAVRFQNVSFSYNQTIILNNVSFNIEAGEKVLLKGPSGSGKSTICGLLSLPSDVKNGIIHLDGVNAADYSLSTIQKSILYVGQNEKLFTGSIRDNILCFREDVNEAILKQVAKICRLEDLVQKRPNRYHTIINSMQNNLSGGEKQRIILARALIKEAKILILDEALSEVNLDLELAIIKDIKKYYPESTLIYVSHKNVEKSFKKIIDMEEINDKYISK